jgi:hypothetical protein
VLDMRDRLVEQMRDVVVVEVVDDAAAVATANDESEVPQEPELVRDGRSLHSHALGDLVDARRPGPQASEDLDPAGRGECLHGLREQAGELGIELIGAS